VAGGGEIVHGAGDGDVAVETTTLSTTTNALLSAAVPALLDKCAVGHGYGGILILLKWRASMLRS
jgi:hypothetical protein